MYSHSNTNHTRYPRTTASGFSILEVVLTAAIILILTGLVIFNYDSFNSRNLLRNQAFEVVLGVRQIQLTALNTRSAGGGNFRAAYGAQFSVGSSSYVFFRDLNNDNPPAYDPGEEIDEFVQFDRRFVIDKLCGRSSVGGVNCSISGNPIETVTVSYRRPNFDALFIPETITGSHPTEEVIVRIRPRAEPDCSDLSKCYDVIMSNAGLIYAQPAT